MRVVDGDPLIWARVDAWLRRRPWVVDAALAVLLAALLLPSSVPFVLDAHWSAAGRAVVIVLLAVAHACVVLRRVATVPAFAITAVVMLVLVLVPDVDGAEATAAGGPIPAILLPSALVFPVLLYAAAAHARPPGPWLALAAGGVGAVLTTVRLWNLPTGMVGDASTGPGMRLFVFGALLASVLAPWALGRFRRVRTAYIAALEEEAARAEEDRLREAEQAASDERARIAREMHDVVAHSLSVIVSQAEGGRLAAGKDPALAVPVLQTVGDTGRAALTEMRGLLGLLHDHGPDEGRAVTAPQPTLERLPELVARVRDAGTPVTFSERGTRGELDRAGELAAYRVVQESLTNVVKHAGAGARADVTLRWGPETLEIEVVDNGVGVSNPTGAGRGLTGMRERLAHAGGHLATGPAAPHGQRVHATLPLITPSEGSSE